MIGAKQLCKSFGKKEVLKDMNCTIKNGSIYGLIGANGAGKSTFLRLISGVYYPQSGFITIDGKEVYENNEIKKKVIFVADEFYIPQGITVRKQAAMYEALYGNFDHEYFEKNLKILSLKLDDKFANYSKGMKRQAIMLCALACKGDYYLFDETFDGLDPVVRNHMKKLLYAEIAERGATIVLTSHNLRELEDICDHLGVLYQGGIMFEGDINDIKSNVFKIQTGFAEDYDESKFKDFEVMSYKKAGSVTTLIIKGDSVSTAAKMRELKPLFLDILPLTLEEVFIYEMEVLGYAFGELSDK